MKRGDQSLFICLLLVILIGAIGCANNENNPTAVPTAVSLAGESQPDDGIEGTDATAAPVDTPTPTPPTATPRPPKQMTICLNAEPESLYLYGDTSLAATAVRHGIYENLYTSLDYAYQPQGLEKLPSLADGDAVINVVPVQEGDRIVNASGDPVRLAPGVQLVTADGNFLTYSDTITQTVQMEQMVVEFTLKPLVWSDGTPVTAVDSVFSYNVAADPATAADKRTIDRTAGYEAVDELTVRWTGLPGFLDETYFLNIWPPLPAHQLSGFTAFDLSTAPEVTEAPLSHGPYVVQSWTQGEQLVLTRNPNYYRADEGLPHVDEVTILFGVTGIDAVRNGRCHVAAQEAVTLLDAPDILAAADAGALIPYFENSLIFEHIDFGINPVEDYAEERPDWFEDVRVRQALTMCTDRQRMIDELMFGQTEILHAYIPDEHPLYPDDAFIQDYDPAAGNGLLDAVGFVDTDGDGVREFVEEELGQIVNTTPFSVTLGTDEDSELRQQINAMFKEDVQACGVHVELYQVPVIDWYADGPFSPLFGRRFDLATFAWLTNIRPPCNLYLSRNVTGPEEQGFGGWSNVNATGWSDEAYDAACEAALAALPGTPEYSQFHREAVRIFSEQLPIIPLFPQVKVAVTAPQVQNFRKDATQPSELWNLYELDLVQPDEE